jgi:hypothetical protein
VHSKATSRYKQIVAQTRCASFRPSPCPTCIRLLDIHGTMVTLPVSETRNASSCVVSRTYANVVVHRSDVLTKLKLLNYLNNLLCIQISARHTSLRGIASRTLHCSVPSVIARFPSGAINQSSNRGSNNLLTCATSRDNLIYGRTGKQDRNHRYQVASTHRRAH